MIKNAPTRVMQAADHSAFRAEIGLRPIPDMPTKAPQWRHLRAVCGMSSLQNGHAAIEIHHFGLPLSFEKVLTKKNTQNSGY
nr:hypothetical protein [uncultured Celeribacter sp.]